MGFQIELKNLSYGVKGNPFILREINRTISSGQFVTVLGENGAGKTTLLDLLMGFRKPTQGSLTVNNFMPHDDPWELRQEIAYLSEKVDIPGDWSVKEFFDFNKFFYKNYSADLENRLRTQFKVDVNRRLGNMSAGEIRRVQVVAALSTRPKLIIVDEITAVLDIIGRRRFMQILFDLNKDLGCTVVLATNIIEDLQNYASHLLLIKQGRESLFTGISEFMNGRDKSQFSQLVAESLESQ